MFHPTQWSVLTFAKTSSNLQICPTSPRMFRGFNGRAFATPECVYFSAQLVAFFTSSHRHQIFRFAIYPNLKNYKNISTIHVLWHISCGILVPLRRGKSSLKYCKPNAPAAQNIIQNYDEPTGQNSCPIHTKVGHLEKNNKN